MTPEEQAALLRFKAQLLRVSAARLDLEAATLECSESFKRLAEALQQGFDVELAQHPDMAELNVFLDSHYA